MTCSPVYLIDDDEAALESTEFLLTALGIQARSFSDPYAFLHVVNSLTPGCILTDLRMPTMSGLELHTSLVGRGIDWPAILMSGHSAIETNMGALDQGIFGMLEKPFTREALVDLLDRACAVIPAEPADSERSPPA